MLLFIHIYIFRLVLLIARLLFQMHDRWKCVIKHHFKCGSAHAAELFYGRGVANRYRFRISWEGKAERPEGIACYNFFFFYDTTLNCSFSYETTSFVRAVEEIWMFVICLHLVRPPPPPIPYLALCWSEKRASWFWAFSRHLQLHGSSCLLHGIFYNRRETDAP